ncbi:MAG: hypothetical protein LBK26_04175 [Rickettsiales bacterium]|jgi:hypothetical protein|nr:hypothetical protein [Rickettsiales bacterium]
MKFSIFAFCPLIFALFGCASPNLGSIDNATVLNWENEMVTTDQFVKDHKNCLGITKPSHMPRSRLSKLLMPNSATQMPDWDGLWVTFQSNEFMDTGQRVLMSVPPNTASKSVGAYRKCMFRKGYLLRAA